VNIVGELKGRISSQTLETLVASNLAKGVHLEGTNGDDLALLFNSLDDIGEAIELCNTLLSSEL